MSTAFRKQTGPYYRIAQGDACSQRDGAKPRMGGTRGNAIKREIAVPDNITALLHANRIREVENGDGVLAIGADAKSGGGRLVIGVAEAAPDADTIEHVNVGIDARLRAGESANDALSGRQPVDCGGDRILDAVQSTIPGKQEHKVS